MANLSNRHLVAWLIATLALLTLAAVANAATLPFSKVFSPDTIGPGAVSTTTTRTDTTDSLLWDGKTGSATRGDG